MTRLIHYNEFRNLIELQSDQVVRNALLYGGDRVLFVDDAPAQDFDMLHLGNIIVEIFCDKRALEHALSNDDGVPGAIDSSSFTQHYIRVQEAIAYVLSNSDNELQKWLRVCLRKAANVYLDNPSKFDLLFFCKTMERFFWDGKAVQGLLRGDRVGVGFELD